MNLFKGEQTMWTSVPDFPTYEASDDGYVRNIKTGKILKNSVESNGLGIPCVSLVRDSKVYVLPVRFVIACTYLGVDIWAKPKPMIEYVDKDKYNNSVTNLRIKNPNSLEGEIWRAVSGFENYYEVSNLGRVKRLAHTDYYIRSDTGTQVERYVPDKILKFRDTEEYYEINLRVNDLNEYRRVHRMVAEAFVPNPDSLPQVNHIDGNKHNNRMENLEWCTSQQNVQHSIDVGLRRHSRKGIDATAKQVRCIETGQVFNTLKEAAIYFNTNAQYIHERINKGKTCHGYHFEILVQDRRVKCLDTGQIFNSIAEASDAFGLKSIGDSIKQFTCTDGWTFYPMSSDIDEGIYLKLAREKYSKWPRANRRWEVS